MAIIANSFIAEHPELAMSSSVQPNPLKRKRDSGCDTACPVGKSLDTRRVDNTGPFVPQLEPNRQGHESHLKSAGSDEPSLVTSPETATKNDPRGSQEGASRHSDPTLNEPISLEILKQTIETEFSLEILLKHRELRLIDQEIAKCQVALEQLRRCQAIPYPAISSELEDMQAVASGSGPSLENTVPRPPPWGIMEGPYTRHYARWLIPDSAFDPHVVDTFSNPFQAGKAGSERTTRGSVSERSHGISSVRTHRGSANSRLQALSHGYPEPREEKGPLILKRSADGRMVKLVCTDCRRDNFNSAQGFINHCRIAHNRGYSSHEAAALACGVEVEGHDNSSCGVVESPASTSIKAGLVHPLIRSSTKAIPLSRNLSLLSSGRKSLRAYQKEVGGSLGSLIGAAESSQNLNPRASSPFIPSPQTPHLSALFTKIGHGGNLNEMVDHAKTRVDVDAQFDHSSDEDDHDEEMEDISQTMSGPRSLSTRGVIGGAGLSRRPGTYHAPLERTPSNKSITGTRKVNPLPNIFSSMTYDSPYAVVPTQPPAPQPHQIDTPLLDPSATLNLSPNPIESHQAPSLISDDDGDEYENTHSESESPSSAEDNGDGGRYFDIEVEDHGDEIGDLGGSDSSNLGLATAVKPHSPGARRSSPLRSPTAIRAGPSARHERRVSFASPGRHSRENLPKAQRRKGGK